MAFRITASELARRVGDILGRVRYKGDAFLIERHGVAIAEIGPPKSLPRVTLREAIALWRGAGPTDPDFASDLERVGKADQPPENPWGS